MSSPASTEAPVEAEVAEFLHEGIVGVVRGVPVVHLLSLGQGLLAEQLHHLHGFGVRGPDNLPEYLGTQPGHPQGIAGNVGHVPRNGGHTHTEGPSAKGNTRATTLQMAEQDKLSQNKGKQRNVSYTDHSFNTTHSWHKISLILSM